MNRVNSFIGVGFAIAIMVGFLVGKITTEAFMVIAGVAIGYFFPKGNTPTGTT